MSLSMNIEELKKLAEECGAVEWSIDPYQEHTRFFDLTENDERIAGVFEKKRADFIRAVNPAAILELVAALEHLTTTNQSLMAALSDAADGLEHVRCVSQHCDACCAFETASRVTNEYNGFQHLLLSRSKDCAHEWVDARNSVVQSGEICLKCNSIRASNQPQALHAEALVPGCPACVGTECFCERSPALHAEEVKP